MSDKGGTEITHFVRILNRSVVVMIESVLEFIAHDFSLDGFAQLADSFLGPLRTGRVAYAEVFGSAGGTAPPGKNAFTVPIAKVAAALDALGLTS